MGGGIKSEWVAASNRNAWRDQPGIGRHADPSADIKSWAIRHNWHPKAAEDLETLARKIWSLKNKPSLVQIHDPDGRYARWKAES